MNLNTLSNQFNNIIKYKNINYFSTNNRILRFDKEIWAIQHFFQAYQRLGYLKQVTPSIF